MKLSDKLTIENINDFMQRFNNLKAILYRLKQKIGYDPETNKLNYSITLTNPENATNDGPFDLESHDKSNYTIQKINEKWIIINGGTSMNSTSVLGLNRHVTNSFLYVATDPIMVHKNASDAEPFMPTVTVDQPYDPKLHYGYDQLRQMLTRVSNQHPGKEIQIIVLGSKSSTEFSQSVELENFSVYYQIAKETEKSDANKANDLVLHYNLEIDSLRLKTSVTLNYLQMRKDHNEIILFDQDRNALDEIYQIYQSTIAAHKPLIIHCDDGERACKLALAFEIFRNFDRYFQSDNPYQIRDNLLTALNDLRRSRSPNALSNMEDVEQATYLAFGLKMVAIQQQCKKELDAHPTSPATKNTINGLIQELDQKTSYENKALHLKKCLLANTELVPTKTIFTKTPPHYPLLKTFLACLESREKIENKLAEVCHCPQNNLNVINLDYQTLK